MKELTSLLKTCAGFATMSIIFGVIFLTRSKSLAKLNHSINQWIQKQ